MKISHRFASLALAAIAFLGTRATTTAQTVSPVPAPTIITSAPYTITRSGYYQLGANINYDGTGAADEAIITISASNVTLDFAGHYIAGPTNSPATQLYGVYANERANVLIQNGTVSYCYIGVYMIGTGNIATTNNRNARVLNMTLTKCYCTGAKINVGVSPEIADCRISSIGGTTLASFVYGINLASSSGSKATRNSVTSVIAGTNGIAYGIAATTYAVGNEVTSCQYGIINCTKYKDNLTSACTTPFSGGTSVGDNN